MKNASFPALALVAALIVGPVGMRAEETRAAGRGPERGERGERAPDTIRGERGGPELEALSPEEREKLRAARQRILQNEKVRLAEAAMQEAAGNLRAAREEALAGLALEDASLEPILKKLREAGRREGEGGRRRGEGDAPALRPPGEPRTSVPQPRRSEGDSASAPRPEGARRESRDGERPARAEGDRPLRPEGDRPGRPEGAREGSREESARPQTR